MKKRNIKGCSLLLLLFMITTMTACGIKDNKTVISKNVSNEAKIASIEIERDIELGNKYLQEGKYDEAKNSYDKAIYMDPTNKQSYLKIKDKYMAKGRIDDEFYIIKLAIKNNVDVANMNVILDGIRKKFGITTIEKNSYENNKFEMPKSMTINVNKVEKLVNIKWDKVEMNTSLVGTYYCNGIAGQYERPVKLTLNVLPEKLAATTISVQPNKIVKPIVKSKQIGYISKVYEEGSKKYLRVDDVELLTGNAANEAAKKNGVATYIDGKYLASDNYYIKNKSKGTKSYVIADNASLNLIECWMDKTSGDIKNHPVSYDNFKNTLSKYEYKLCHIYTENDVVVKVEGQYTP